MNSSDADSLENRCPGDNYIYKGRSTNVIQHIHLEDLKCKCLKILDSVNI